MGKRGRVGWQIYSAARTEAKETRMCPSLPHPNKRLPIRIGGQGWGDEIQHTCVRSQTHQLPWQGLLLGRCPSAQNPMMLRRDRALQISEALVSHPMLSLLVAAGRGRCRERRKHQLPWAQCLAFPAICWMPLEKPITVLLPWISQLYNPELFTSVINP